MRLTRAAANSSAVAELAAVRRVRTFPAIVRTAVFSFILCLAALAAEPPKFTDAIRADIQLMRERVSVPGGTGAVYASERAIAAAQRVFATLPLTGLTRQDVIAVLGEPHESIVPSGSPSRGQLTYRFDGGYGGWEYLLTLDEHGRITKVTRNGID